MSRKSGSSTASWRYKALRGRPQPLVIRLTEINQYITCHLCSGYYVDATTIIECLHTFCKSCLVQYLHSSKKCPTCDVLIHETNPFSCIRFDRTKQDVLNKLLPYVSSDEHENKTLFYKQRGIQFPEQVETHPARSSPIQPSTLIQPSTQIQPSTPIQPLTPIQLPTPPPTPPPQPPPVTPPPLLSPQQPSTQSPKAVGTLKAVKHVTDTHISLLLEFIGASHSYKKSGQIQQKYVRVSQDTSIRHIQRFINKKLKLGNTYEVDIVCGVDIMEPDLILKNLSEQATDDQFQDGILLLHYSLVDSEIFEIS